MNTDTPIPTALVNILEAAEAHIFDVDHTLTHHSTGRRFAQVGHRMGIFSARYVAYLPIFYLRYRLGHLTLADLTREIKPLTGRSRETLEEIVKAAWDRYIKHDLYPQAVGYIAACRNRGVPIILASTSFDIILQPLADELSADETIASTLEFTDGRATGWISSGPCYAEEKARRIGSTLEKIGVAPERCAFYTDSFHDLPSLELVGYPVAVHPDVALRRIANRRAWPRIRWDRG